MFTYDTFYSNTNKPITKRLFLEVTGDKAKALYTLKNYDVEVDGKVYKSIYKAYLDEEDQTEFLFATKYFMHPEVWVAITKCAWFKKTLKRMRTDLVTKIKSKALLAIAKEAVSNGRNSFQANKFLVEQDFVPEVTTEMTKAPRKPSLHEITKEELATAANASQGDLYDKQDAVLLKLVRN